LDTTWNDDGRNSNQWEDDNFRWKIINECNLQECPTDCEVSEWSTWGSCSHSCRVAAHTDRHGVAHAAAAKPQKHRYRTVTVGNLDTMTGHKGGLPCPTLHDQADCNAHNWCPIDCVVTMWTKYDACTKTCNGGTRTRTRSISTPVEHGGKACPSTEQTVVCGAEKCGTDCKISGDLFKDTGGTDHSKMVTLPNGWMGAGSAENYCNKCQCLDGEYSCSQKKCGPQFTHNCNYMTCSYTNEILVIRHHHHDYGHGNKAGNVQHRCGYDLFKDKCICHCE